MLTELTASDLSRLISAREVGCVEVATAFLDRMEALDPKVGAFITVDRDSALLQAAHAQSLVEKGEAGPLTGIPIALKDNLSTEGLETTCGSRILKGYVPPFDATVVSLVKQAGMAILGKTNLDEFAMGTSTENSAFHLTKNPWDLTRSPGGSSGGSAAAVAADFAPIALGSDTGGSVRQPAALCGVVGFKPTYGRCSRYGLIAFGSSLDQIGSFGKTVEDIALISEAITGHDAMDSTSLQTAPIFAKDLKSGSLRGLKIALPKELFGSGTAPGVATQVQAAIDILSKEGVEFSEVSIPSVGFGVTTYYIIAPAEASSNLARFDGVRFGPRSDGQGHVGVVERTRSEGFGHEVKSRIMIGTYALSAGYYDAYYLKAQQVRTIMQREFERIFQEYDAVLSPTSPVPAFKLGELTDDPMALKLLDYCTIPANLGGMPGISLNCGFTEGLPVGLQFMSAPLADEKLLQIAYCAEQALPTATLRPSIS